MKCPKELSVLNNLMAQLGKSSMLSVRKISPENETNETSRGIMTLITILVLDLANIYRAHQN